MLPLIGIVVGQLLGNQIVNLIKKDQEGKYEYKYHFIKIKYIQLSYNENIKRKQVQKRQKMDILKDFIQQTLVVIINNI